MIRKMVYLMAVAGLAMTASGQVLFDNGRGAPNGGIEDGAASPGGIAAPPGTMWSFHGYNQTAQLVSTIVGLGAQGESLNSVADNFTVPAGQTWSMNGAEFWSYETGAATGASTITAVSLTVLRASPATATAADVVTTFSGAPASSVFANVYRTGSGVTCLAAPSALRPVFITRANIPAATLSAGSYWIVWNLTGGTLAGPWIPNISPQPFGTAVGFPDGNALQGLGTGVNPAPGSYIAPAVPELSQLNACAATGPNIAVEFPFRILGSQSGGCRPDLTTGAIPGQPGYGTPNNVLNNDDFFYYLSQFAAGNLAVADMTTTAIPGSPGYGTPNGVINNDDFFFYLTIFSAGC